jgi:hypothetical protein
MSVNDVRTAHELVRQYDAVWGLSRISHSHPQRCGNDEYIYDYSAATGTRAYVIDTGIYIEHNVRPFLLDVLLMLMTLIAIRRPSDLGS